MDISNLAFKLIIILIPGIIVTLLIKNLTVTKNWDSFKFSVYTLLFSGITYLLLQTLENLFLWIVSKITQSTFNLNTLEIWNKLTEEGSIPYREVILACLLSIFVGLLASYSIRKKFLFRIAKFLKVSYKFGDENLFYHFMRRDETNAVYLKDIENNIIYHGYVDYYSESETIREILLKNVDVYSYEDSKFYYYVPSVYLSQAINKNWIIELPNIKIEENVEINKDGSQVGTKRSKTKT